MLYLTFILTAMALIALPGPNVLVIVSTSLSHGTKRGLQTVLGTSSAMVLQLMIASMSTLWFVETMTGGFLWLRWLGTAYLLYLGALHLIDALLHKENCHAQVLSASGSFRRGFFVSLMNPKTILFFGAFLPQFVSSNGNYMHQIIVLSATFLALATCMDSMYATLAGHFRTYLQNRRSHNIQTGVTGILYLGAGVWLGLLRKN